MKKMMVAALKEAVRTAVSAFLAAMGLGAIFTTQGCTTVVVPKDESKPLTVNGGVLPVGLQFNSTTKAW